MFLTTKSGATLNLLDISRDAILLKDIAAGLSHIRRFNGQTEVGYCVAAHALHVSDIVRLRGASPAAQLAALHHDAHEYLMGDITSPMKDLINEMSGYALAAIEQRMQRSVLQALGVWAPYMSHQSLIHEADMIALATERRDLQPANIDEWPCLEGFEPDPIDVRLRASFIDEFWAEAYIERDTSLRERLCDRAGYSNELSCI